MSRTYRNPIPHSPAFDPNTRDREILSGNRTHSNRVRELLAEDAEEEYESLKRTEEEFEAHLEKREKDLDNYLDSLERD